MRLFLPLLLLVAAQLPASAANADRGEAFAKENCGRCHALDAASPSPHKQAPPFRYVARQGDPAALEEALAEGIVVGHRDMPEFALSPAQIDDFIAFLRRLRRG